jgi:hypothetical protein
MWGGGAQNDPLDRDKALIHLIFIKHLNFFSVKADINNHFPRLLAIFGGMIINVIGVAENGHPIFGRHIIAEKILHPKALTK